MGSQNETPALPLGLQASGDVEDQASGKNLWEARVMALVGDAEVTPGDRPCETWGRDPVGQWDAGRSSRYRGEDRAPGPGVGVPRSCG